ncbi:hypothetical protein PR003_g13003 [Phytophthora rubi]|uniref:Secreted protein n=1 Tax=Phytophthora rubi TaxID=129364 RepID=A0A6A4FIP4_9STRA|nr:hypothetical protein PR003_g13003 [Phytophthora rubi]
MIMLLFFSSASLSFCFQDVSRLFSGGHVVAGTTSPALFMSCTFIKSGALGRSMVAPIRAEADSTC